MKCCTIHQRIRNGSPFVRGSVVRTPDGSEIPCTSVVVTGELGQGLWMAELKMPVVFGDPVDQDPGPSLWPDYNKPPE